MSRYLLAAALLSNARWVDSALRRRRYAEGTKGTSPQLHPQPLLPIPRLRRAIPEKSGPSSAAGSGPVDLLAVNLRGVFLAIQAVVAHMPDGGRVITIGSNTAIRTGHRGTSVYAMTKAAVASMVQNVALDLAPRQITVNHIQPGPIETDMTVEFIASVTAMVPLGVWGNRVRSPRSSPIWQARIRGT